MTPVRVALDIHHLQRCSNVVAKRRVAVGPIDLLEDVDVASAREELILVLDRVLRERSREDDERERVDRDTGYIPTQQLALRDCDGGEEELQHEGNEQEGDM